MRAASASRNNSDARVVTPAVAENLFAADFFRSGERDGGDAETDRVRGRVARFLQLLDDRGNVIARDRAVAERGGEKKQRGGEAEPRRRQPRDADPDARDPAGVAREAGGERRDTARTLAASPIADARMVRLVNVRAGPFP